MCFAVVLFQADKKADLSCGTLYAARLESVGVATDSKANFAVKWIKLGYGEASGNLTTFMNAMISTVTLAAFCGIQFVAFKAAQSIAESPGACVRGYKH